MKIEKHIEAKDEHEWSESNSIVFMGLFAEWRII